MSTQKSLEKYTKAFEALEDHRQKHIGIFDAHQALVLTLIDAENELRDDVAEGGVGIENTDFKVTITPQTQVFADVEEVDKLVKDKLISPEIRAKIVKTNQRPPKISIKRKE